MFIHLSKERAYERFVYSDYEMRYLVYIRWMDSRPIVREMW